MKTKTSVITIASASIGLIILTTIFVIYGKSIIENLSSKVTLDFRLAVLKLTGLIIGILIGIAMISATIRYHRSMSIEGSLDKVTEMNNEPNNMLQRNTEKPRKLMADPWKEFGSYRLADEESRTRMDRYFEIHNQNMNTLSTLKCLEQLKKDAGPDIIQHNVQNTQLNEWLDVFRVVIDTAIQCERYIEEYCNSAISNNIHACRMQKKQLSDDISNNDRLCSELASDFASLLEKASNNLLDKTSLSQATMRSNLMLIKLTDVVKNCEHLNLVLNKSEESPKQISPHTNLEVVALSAQLLDKDDNFQKSFVEGNQNNLPTTLSDVDVSTVQTVNNVAGISYNR